MATILTAKDAEAQWRSNSNEYFHKVIKHDDVRQPTRATNITGNLACKSLLFMGMDCKQWFNTVVSTCPTLGHLLAAFAFCQRL
eukprot:4869866-Amphidinium_carterae.1